MNKKQIRKNLKGLYNLSPPFTADTYFSKCSCECCGSKLAGDRCDIMATKGKKHTDPKLTLSVCFDCYFYLFS